MKVLKVGPSCGMAIGADGGSFQNVDSGIAVEARGRGLKPIVRGLAVVLGERQVVTACLAGGAVSRRGGTAPFARRDRPGAQRGEPAADRWARFDAVKRDQDLEPIGRKRLAGQGVEKRQELRGVAAGGDDDGEERRRLVHARYRDRAFSGAKLPCPRAHALRRGTTRWCA